MNRGTIAWINLEDARPPEFGKTRPAIIVSSSVHNARLATVVVVPLSSHAPEIWPLRVQLSNKGGFAIVPGIRQVTQARIGAHIGDAPTAFMAKLDEAIRIYLAD